MQTSVDIAHAADYAQRHGSPRKTDRSASMPRPPAGQCFECHSEPVLPGQSFGLKCSIRADLNWVEGQMKFGGAR